jgi:SNF2 family DNA or RNA helicase
MSERFRWLLAHTMGAGKSATAIALSVLTCAWDRALHCSAEGGSRGFGESKSGGDGDGGGDEGPDHGGLALFVVPASVVAQWRREWCKFTDVSEDFSVNLKPKHLDTMAWQEVFARARVAVTTMESLASWMKRDDDVGDRRRRWLFTAPFSIVVVDECHKARNADTSTTRVVARFMRRLKTDTRVIGLTGTPMYNSDVDLFTQHHVFAKIKLPKPGRGMGEWRAEGKTEAMQLYIVKNFADVVSQDVLKLPALELKHVPVVVSPTVCEAYLRIITNLIKTLAQFASASSKGKSAADIQRLKAIVGSLRNRAVDILVQPMLVTGYPWELARPSPGTERSRVTPLRLKNHAKRWLKHIQKDITLLPPKYAKTLLIVQKATKRGSKVLVFARRLRVIVELCAMLSWYSISSRPFMGCMSTDDRDAAVQAIQTKDGGVSVLVMSYGAGCVGINLTAANVMVLVDQPSNRQIHQAICRTHRFGQAKNVTVYSLQGRRGVLESVPHISQVTTIDDTFSIQRESLMSSTSASGLPVPASASVSKRGEVGESSTRVRSFADALARTHRTYDGPDLRDKPKKV